MFSVIWHWVCFCSIIYHNEQASAWSLLSILNSGKC